MDDDSVSDDSTDWRRNRNIDLVVGPNTPTSYLEEIEDYSEIRSLEVHLNGWGEERRNPNMSYILNMVSSLGYYINIELRLVESEGKFPSSTDYMFARAIELQIRHEFVLDCQAELSGSDERADFKVVMDFGKENQDDAIYCLRTLKVINKLEIYQKERLTTSTISELPEAIVSAGVCRKDSGFENQVQHMRIQVLSQKLFDGLVAGLKLCEPMCQEYWKRSGRRDYYCTEIFLLSKKGETLSYCVRVQQLCGLHNKFPDDAILKRIVSEVGKNKKLRSLCLSLFEYTNIQDVGERNRDDEENWTSPIFKAFQIILGTLASSKSLEKLFIAAPRFCLSETEGLNKAILKICRNQTRKLKSISHNSNGMPLEAALDYLHRISILPKNTINYEVVIRQMYGRDMNSQMDFYDRLIPILPRLAVRRFSLLGRQPRSIRHGDSDNGIPSTTFEKLYEALKANKLMEHIDFSELFYYDDMYSIKVRHHCTNNKMSNLLESIRNGSLPIGIAADTLSRIQGSRDWQWGQNEEDNCKSDSITGLYRCVHAFLPLIALSSEAHSPHMQQGNKRPKLS